MINKEFPFFQASRVLRAAFSVAMISLILGCSAYSSHIPAEQAKKTPDSRVLAFKNAELKGVGTVVVTRDSGSLGWMCFTELSINGIIAARFGIGETTSFSVPSGEMDLRVGADSAGEGICSNGIYVTRESSVKPGETKYFRISRTIDMIDIQRVDR